MAIFYQQRTGVLKLSFILNSCYLIGKKSRNALITENDDCEMTVMEKSRLKVVIKDGHYLVFEITVTKKLVVSKILLMG